LKPQEKVTISLTLDKRAFAFWDIGAQKWIVEAGEFEVLVGTSSQDILLSQAVALTSPDVSSDQAQRSHPPMKMPLLHINDSDAAFKAMLGKDIPLASLPQKLEYNSLLGDTQHTLLGRMIKSLGVSLMLAHAKIPSAEEIKFSNALLHSTPMRSLVLFSRGDMEFVVLDLILHIMNRELLAAICLFPWMICVVMYHQCFTRKNKV
jgi:beta-glucosidase